MGYTYFCKKARCLRFTRFSCNLLQIGSDASRSSHRTWVGDFVLSLLANAWLSEASHPLALSCSFLHNRFLPLQGLLEKPLHSFFYFIWNSQFSPPPFSPCPPPACNIQEQGCSFPHLFMFIMQLQVRGLLCQEIPVTKSNVPSPEILWSSHFFLMLINTTVFWSLFLASTVQAHFLRKWLISSLDFTLISVWPFFLRVSPDFIVFTINI